MRSQKKLEMALQPLALFRDPKVALEQYHTPANIAAAVLFCVHGEGHLEALEVADLGCGTGMLAIGCALMGAARVLCIDVDEDALAVLRDNATRLEVAELLDVRCEDVQSDSVAEDGAGVCDVVVMNPPFGTRSKGADMGFLKRASLMARVAVYSMHKTSTRNHIAKSVASLGFASGRPIAQLRYNLAQTHKHHKKDSVDIEVDLWRFDK